MDARNDVCRKNFSCAVFFSWKVLSIRPRVKLSGMRLLEMAADFCRDLLIKLGVNEKNYVSIGDNNKFWCMFAQIKVQTKPFKVEANVIL